MILDSSALLAVALLEADNERYVDAMIAASARNISAGTWLEVFIVAEGRRWPAAMARLENLIKVMRLEIRDVTAEHAQVARLAWSRFGRGNHPAALNYGDCFAYALAKVTGEPLLFKGDDFSQTDIEPALKA